MGRPPPPVGYPPIRTRRSRRPLVLLVLLVVTLVAGGYLYLSNRGGPGLANDFVSVTQRVATDARSLPVAARKVQRFDEIGTFSNPALVTINQMNRDDAVLSKIAKTETGRARQIAQRAVSAAGLAIAAAIQYRNAVAFSFNLSKADRNAATLFTSAATLDQEAQAWQKR
jgi:hypothetical protein